MSRFLKNQIIRWFAIVVFLGALPSSAQSVIESKDVQIASPGYGIDISQLTAVRVNVDGNAQLWVGDSPVSRFVIISGPIEVYIPEHHPHIQLIRVDSAMDVRDTPTEDQTINQIINQQPVDAQNDFGFADILSIFDGNGHTAYLLPSTRRSAFLAPQRTKHTDMLLPREFHVGAYLLRITPETNRPRLGISAGGLSQSALFRRIFTWQRQILRLPSTTRYRWDMFQNG